MLRKNRWITVMLFLMAAVAVLAIWQPWQTWRPAPVATAVPEHTRFDRLVVHKAQRKLEAYAGGQLVKTYDIALGKVPTGAKQIEGDKKTPEGLYTIADKNPNSGYHKNLGISYPQAKDRALARQLGAPPGHSIKIHGLPNYLPDMGRLHLTSDWTDGCIAVTNEDVDELFLAVPVGTPIDIQP